MEKAYEEKVQRELGRLAQKLPDKVRKHDDFEFVKDIGKGGFGKVVLAKHKKTGQLCAYKEIFEKRLTGRQFRHYIDEALTMSKCHNPFVLDLFGFTIEPPYAIITPYMPGGSLSEMINKKNEKLTPTQKTKICMGIAYGMAHVNSRNIYHRDLKSGNVLLDNNMNPKICDFGIARIAIGDDLHLTGKIGTPISMAPELQATTNYTSKVDVYAYSIILYEMVHGIKPYKGMKLSEFQRRVLVNGERADINKDTPQALRDLISACWAQNPDERPPFEAIYKEFAEGRVFFEGTDPEEIKKFAKYTDAENERIEKELHAKMKQKMIKQHNETTSKIKKSEKKVEKEAPKVETTKTEQTNTQPKQEQQVQQVQQVQQNKAEELIKPQVQQNKQQELVKPQIELKEVKKPNKNDANDFHRPIARVGSVDDLYAKKKDIKPAPTLEVDSWKDNHIPAPPLEIPISQTQQFNDFGPQVKIGRVGSFDSKADFKMPSKRSESPKLKAAPPLYGVPVAQKATQQKHAPQLAEISNPKLSQHQKHAPPLNEIPIMQNHQFQRLSPPSLSRESSWQKPAPSLGPIAAEKKLQLTSHRSNPMMYAVPGISVNDGPKSAKPGKAAPFLFQHSDSPNSIAAPAELLFGNLSQQNQQNADADSPRLALKIKPAPPVDVPIISLNNSCDILGAEKGLRNNLHVQEKAKNVIEPLPQDTQVIKEIEEQGNAVNASNFAEFIEKVCSKLEGNKQLTNSMIQIISNALKGKNELFESFAKSRFFNVLSPDLIIDYDSLLEDLSFVFVNCAHLFNAGATKIIEFALRYSPEKTLILLSHSLKQNFFPNEFIQILISSSDNLINLKCGDFLLFICGELIRRNKEMIQTFKPVFLKATQSKISSVSSAAFSGFIELLPEFIPEIDHQCVLNNLKTTPLAISIALRNPKLVSSQAAISTLASLSRNNNSVWDLLLLLARENEGAMELARNPDWMEGAKWDPQMAFRVFLMTFGHKETRNVFLENQAYFTFLNDVTKSKNPFILSSLPSIFHRQNTFTHESLEKINNSGFLHSYVTIALEEKSDERNNNCLVIFDTFARIGYSPEYVVFLRRIIETMQNPKLFTNALSVLLLLSFFPQCAAEMKRYGLLKYFTDLEKYKQYSILSRQIINNLEIK